MNTTAFSFATATAARNDINLLFPANTVVSAPLRSAVVNGRRLVTRPLLNTRGWMPTNQKRLVTCVWHTTFKMCGL